MAYSSDGLTWTSVTTDAFNYKDSVDGKTYQCYIDAITYGGDKFVAAGSYDGNKIKLAYSSDGLTWTPVTSNAFNYVSYGNTRQWNNNIIAYGNGKFVAGGETCRMATSTNGSTWTSVTTNVFNSEDQQWGKITAIAYGNNKFVAASGDLSEPKIVYSSDN